MLYGGRRNGRNRRSQVARCEQSRDDHRRRHLDCPELLRLLFLATALSALIVGHPSAVPHPEQTVEATQSPLSGLSIQQGELSAQEGFGPPEYGRTMGWRFSFIWLALRLVPPISWAIVSRARAKFLSSGPHSLSRSFISVALVS